MKSAVAVTVLLACVPAHAAKSVVKNCLTAPAGDAPQTFDELRSCQDDARAKAVRKARKKGRTLSQSELEAIDEQQRSETRRFFAANDVVVDGGAPAAPEKPEPKLGGATPGDLAQVDAKSAAALAGLQARLQSAAGDGRQGITPAMSADIVNMLTQAQGGISSDMKALLDAVAKDGGKLTPETMKLLQGAGQSAKGQKLDLNVDPDMEKALLTHDFEGDKKYVPPAPGAAPSSPGSL